METDVILRSCDAGFPSVMKSEAWSGSADAVRDASACSYPLRKLHGMLYLSFPLQLLSWISSDAFSFFCFWSSTRYCSAVGRLKLQSVSLQFILQGDGEGIRRSWGLEFRPWSFGQWRRLKQMEGLKLYWRVKGEVEGEGEIGEDCMAESKKKIPLLQQGISLYIVFLFILIYSPSFYFFVRKVCYQWLKSC